MLCLATLLAVILLGEYILKFQDDGGRFSTGETSVVIDFDNVSALSIKQEEKDQIILISRNKN